MLKENERLDSLEYKNLGIIQSNALYRFTSDAVLLANSVKAGKKDRVCDLGTGSGIIAILIAAKRGAHVTGVEIQPELADMARRSVAYNGMSDVVDIKNCRIQDAADTVGTGFDAVVVNPPYGKKADAIGIVNASEALARTEQAVTLGEIAAAANKLLRFGGRFYIIVKTVRLAEIINLFSACKIEPKELTLIMPCIDKPPDTAIVAGVRGGKVGLKVNKPLIVCGADGGYTDDVKSLIDGGCMPR
ncbi:MAG: methyltransferase [Clostridiales bacterium]|jgi:tRNA1Val (adenine37-N6)-methyltransferase|nr:methyltransferase [Clostridiales bacterium]